MLLRIWSVMQKELAQTLRDRRTLLVQLSMPVIELFLFGYAVRMNVQDIPLVVADYSLDPASVAYVDALTTSGYFEVLEYVPEEAQVLAAIDAGQAQAGVIIPPDFAARSERGEGQTLLLVDGSDMFTSQSAYNAALVISQNHVMDLVVQRIARSGRMGTEPRLLPLELRTRILYNPSLDDLWFLIPAMLAMLLQVQTVTLTAASVVREREAGTIEQLLVTPIRSVELMVGKVVPNIAIAYVNLLTIVGLGVFWFRVPFRGDFRLFLWLSFLYVFSGLGLGLLVSTISHNQRQSQQLAGMLALLGVVLGGFIFPRYSMPAPIRILGNLFPLTYFIPIARSIISKGVGLPYFWEQVAALGFYTIVIMVVAAATFRERLE